MEFHGLLCHLSGADLQLWIGSDIHLAEVVFPLAGLLSSALL